MNAPEPYTFAPPGRLIDAMRQADEPGLRNLAAGVPAPDILPAEALEAAWETARSREGKALWAYHHPEGDPALREQLGALLRSRGVDSRPGEVLTLTGCSQGLALAVDLLVRPGDIVACEVPAYYALLELLSRAGARILELPVRGAEGFDPAELEALCARWRPKALFTCPALANPTGASLPEAARPAVVEICRRHGVPIVEDDIYSMLDFEGARSPLRRFDPEGELVTLVSSFSKTVSPGLRAGYALPARALREAFAERKVQWDMHSAVPTEATMREFLAAGRLGPHLEALRERFLSVTRQAAEVIAGAFPAGTQLGPVRGNYMLWVELPPGTDMARLAAAARKERIVFCPGAIFHPRPPERPSMRLNCAKLPPADLLEALRRLGELAGRARP
jgi:DNA-binding transcriptional MocR family regulator